MLKRLHVALVYNLKKDGSDETSGEDGDPNKRRTPDGAFAVATKFQKTKADTYAEWDTEETILAVQSALEQHHSVTLIEADEESYSRLLASKPDIVFNIAEGLRGPSREAQIPAMLEMLGIPYTGSDPLTLGICLDKSRAKEILAYHKIATPAFFVADSVDAIPPPAFPFPAIVKPLHEGSSKGIFNSSIVRTPAELQDQTRNVLDTYGQPALVEQFLTGREFTVAVLGNDGDARTLPIVEIKFDSLPEGVNHIYSYEAKWVWDNLDHPIDVHQCPARLNPHLERRIRETCLAAYRILRCRDWSRIDIRLDDQETPHVLELNPLPGILPNPDEHSCFPQAARAAGIGYAAMINSVLSAALKRYGMLDTGRSDFSQI